MRWLLPSHVRRYPRHYHSSGHVYQGRCRSFPIPEDDHLLAVRRYSERNPVRAGLAERAPDGRWSSASLSRGDEPPPLDPGPVPRPAAWLEHVHAPQTEAELEALRECIRRRRPYGADAWVERAAGPLGLEASLRPRGRPRKRADDAPRLRSNRSDQA